MTNAAWQARAKVGGDMFETGSPTIETGYGPYARVPSAQKNPT
jgi:hypothetical protein